MSNEQPKNQSEVIANAKKKQEQITKQALRAFRFQKLSILARNIAIVAFLLLIGTSITTTARALAPAPAEQVTITKPEPLSSSTSNLDTDNSPSTDTTVKEPGLPPGTEPEPTDEIPLDIDLNPEGKENESPYRNTVSEETTNSAGDSAVDASAEPSSVAQESLAPLGETASFTPSRSGLDVALSIIFSGWTILFEAIIFSAALMAFLVFGRYSINL